MKIKIHLSWNLGVKKKALKHSALNELLFEYKERLEKYIPCEILGAPSQGVSGGSLVGTIVWCCDIKEKGLSSEDLSKQLEKVMNSGAQSLKIIIGGADGLASYKGPKDFVWSFGPMTLPHELASVVALEQLYRAFTIIKKHPYHCGH